MTIELRQSTAITLRFGPMVDATDGITPETGLTISQADRKFSKNGAAFAQTSDTNAATHDTGGFYSASYTATDTNTLGSLRLSVQESGAAPFFETYTVISPVEYDARYIHPMVRNALHYGYAQSGSSLAVALATSASSTDNYYNGCFVAIVAGTGAGQARYVEDYTGSSRSVTIPTAWTTNPSTDSLVCVLPWFGSSTLTEMANAVNGQQITGSLNSDGTRPTIRQAILGAYQALTEAAISSNNLLIKDVDGSTTLRTVALSPDATTPTSRTVTG